MANMYNFTFDNLSRIGDDNCGISEREVQNQNFGNYSVQSYFLNNCGMKKTIDFATAQPNIFYKGSKMMGLGGCNVDNDSKELLDLDTNKAKKMENPEKNNDSLKSKEKN